LTITLYGIRNCDTMKRARAWLDAHAIAYAFHDYKLAGLERATLERWLRELGRERLLNRSGTTFRKLDESVRAAIDDERALALMLAQPSMIRRPLLDTGNGLVVGFDPQEYAARLRPGR
jgi:arsenate reductase